MPKLQVLNGKRQGAVFEVPPETELLIGHRQEAAICIDDPWVSWDHARLIYKREAGTCWIEDLGSTNGTYVNCVRVKREQLRHEDIIFLGKTHLIYLAPVELSFAGPGEPATDTGKHTALGTPAIDAALLAGPPPFDASSGEGAPFASDSGLPPLREPVARDPFASRSSQNRPAPLWNEPAPPRPAFAQSSADPFSSGPDYSGPESADLTVPPPANNPFAETRGDEVRSPLSEASGRSLLSLSSLGEFDDLNLPGPSGEEISRLIEGWEGDTASQSGIALPPEPSASLRPVPGEPTVPLSAMRPSEMRTQPIDTEAVNRILAEQRGTPPPPPPPPPPPAHPTGPTRTAPGEAIPAIDPAQATGDAALEARRLRLMLDALQAERPEAVAAAARELREAELEALHRRISELEGLLAERERELNEVTDAMIEKEDLIDSLRDQLAAARGAHPLRPAANGPADAGARSVAPASGELGSLSDSQDWSSLEF
ncbi:MAG: FHA domain-containing protein [Planctomycetota bacterium]|nr:MAG: FHA domain-containing protein [Planctomycetota bacterium]